MSSGTFHPNANQNLDPNAPNTTASDHAFKVQPGNQVVVSGPAATPQLGQDNLDPKFAGNPSTAWPKQPGA